LFVLLILNALPSTWIVAMVQVSSFNRPEADLANGITVISRGLREATKL
jgi:hypothetical protein